MFTEASGDRGRAITEIYFWIGKSKLKQKIGYEALKPYIRDP
jgi:hypothetical protein